MDDAQADPVEQRSAAREITAKDAAPRPSRKVELVLEQLDGLPTLSPIATRLLAISSREDFDVGEVTTLIESDPSLTARILGLCRKADKGLGDRITTVRRAVLMLGIEAVQSAVLSVAVYDLMDRAGHEADEKLRSAGHRGPVFDREGFWRYAVAVACTSELIAGAHPKLRIKPDEAFVAGLLCDLGKLVLDITLPRAFARVVELAERQRSDIASIERTIIGLDHHVAGKRIGERWGLPPMLRDVMWLHSQPLAAIPDVDHRDLISVVTVACALVRHLHIGWSGDFGQPPAIEALAQEAELDPHAVNDLLPKLHEAVAARCELMGLGKEASPSLLLRSIFTANRRLAKLNEMVERRTAQTGALERAAAEAQRFLASAGPGNRLMTTLAAVARSAFASIDPTFCAFVYQADEAEQWEVLRFAGDGSLLASSVVDRPAMGRASLAEVVREDDAGPIGVVHWIADELRDADDIRGLRAVTLHNEHDEHGAVLLFEPKGAGSLHDSALDLLASAWTSAIAASAEHERSERLGERLVTANRSLASAQHKLTEQASMARLGQMTAGAAHEMNNPLTVISARAQQLARIGADGKAKDAARAIVEASSELSDLITALNLLASPPEPTPVSCSLAQILRDGIAEGVARARLDDVGGDGVGGEAAERVQLDGSFGVGGTELEVRVDRTMIVRAVAELVANALEAGGDEVVRVRAQADPLDDRLLCVVEDRGCGLTDRAARHAFDPFFSDKPAGRQPGLGLSRAKRLVELHGGVVGLEPSPEGGTIATIGLPWSPAASGTTAFQRQERRGPDAERRAA